MKNYLLPLLLVSGSMVDINRVDIEDLHQTIMPKRL